MSRKRAARSMRVTEHLASGQFSPYDPTTFPEDLLYRDKVVSQLGAAVDGWIPELVYRYAIHGPLGINVDWAIMINAYREDDTDTGETRRRVERIDICDSEVHIHRFRQSDDPHDDQGRRSRIISLYTGDEATVNRQWDMQMANLSREWPERLRRWIDG